MKDRTRVRERIEERKREKGDSQPSSTDSEIFHLLIYSQEELNSHGWDRRKLEPRTLSRSATCTTRTQALGQHPPPSQEARSEAQQMGPNWTNMDVQAATEPDVPALYSFFTHVLIYNPMDMKSIY